MESKAIALAGLLVVLAAPGGSALAQSAATLGELDTIQAETLLLQAKVKYETQRRELNKIRAEAVGASDGTLPTVKQIVWTDHRQTITFLYPGDIRVQAQAGQAIPGGYVVGKVAEDMGSVELWKGKERVVVGSSGGGTAAQKTTVDPRHAAPGMFR